MIADAQPVADALHDAFGPKRHRVVAGHNAEVVDALERVFGLPIKGNNVRRVEMNFEVGEAVTATLHCFAGIDEGQVRTEFRSFEVGL